MAEMKWWNAVQMISPHVVRISTPQGSGSGFLISDNRQRGICGVATAAHVVGHAHYWEEPIRIDHVSSGTSVVVRRDERAVFLDANRDTAAMLFLRSGLGLPSDPLPLIPKDMVLSVGNKIGWLGFPAIPTANLCFFSGDISAWLQEQMAYLVDGVAINGVSGGPAFCIVDENVIIIGVVSAYVPNRATGEVLPGLSVVRDVAQFHELAPTFASLDQAREAEPPADPPPPKPTADGFGETPTGRAT